jgi:inner membrane transporter RhtA
VVGAIVLAPIGLPGSGTVWGSPHLLAACLAVGVFSSAIAYGLDQHTLRRIPVRRFSVLSALLPITALAVGFVALDQRPTAVELVGVALVIGGVLVQEREELAQRVEGTIPSDAATAGRRSFHTKPS